jgi:hypothetical protein
VTDLALRRHSHVAVTPTVHEHAGRLLDATLYRDLFNLDPRHPGRATLLTMGGFTWSSQHRGGGWCDGGSAAFRSGVAG